MWSPISTQYRYICIYRLFSGEEWLNLTFLQAFFQGFEFFLAKVNVGNNQTNNTIWHFCPTIFWGYVIIFLLIPDCSIWTKQHLINTENVFNTNFQQMCLQFFHIFSFTPWEHWDYINIADVWHHWHQYKHKYRHQHIFVRNVTKHSFITLLF